MMSTSKDDLDFLMRLRSGCPVSTAQLFDRHWEPLYRYAYAILKDHDDAEDAVQDTFISFLAQKEKFSEIQSLQGYLYTILRNNCIGIIKKSIRFKEYTASFDSFLNQKVKDPESEFCDRETLSLISQEIQKLPPKMRAIFVLKWQEDLSYQEIEQELGISNHTVKKQLYNSLKLLKSKFYFFSSTFLLLTTLTY